MKKLLYIIMTILGFLCLSTTPQAAPWLDSGDPRLRHDLQLLADQGLLHAPIISWPLPAGDIMLALESHSVETVHEPEVQRALSRVNKSLRRKSRVGEFQTHFRGALAPNPHKLHSYRSTAREQGELELGVEWMGNRFATRLQGQVVSDPDDDETYRYDGSYLATILGNWTLSVNTMDHWWGPGWEDSLIFSSNARPFPKVTIQRNYSDPWDFPVLSWLGPWRFTSFLGLLETDRAQERPKVFGSRMEFAPITSVQLGISTTAMFGGKGRSGSFNNLVDLYRGEETSNEEKIGYRMTSMDARWKVPRLPWALYGQVAEGTDEGEFGDDPLTLWGMESWKGIGDTGHSIRVYLEYSEVPSNVYQADPYPQGYQYWQRPIGHSTSDEGELGSLSASWVSPDNWMLHARYRTGTIQQAGKESERDYEEAQVGLDNYFPDGSQWNVDLGWRYYSDTENDHSEDEFYGQLGISNNF